MCLSGSSKLGSICRPVRCVCNYCLSILMSSLFYLFSSSLCGLRWCHPRPVHSEGCPQPGVACGLPQVHRVPNVPRRDVHMLCKGGKDFLQEGLCQVRQEMYAEQIQVWTVYFYLHELDIKEPRYCLFLSN